MSSDPVATAKDVGSWIGLAVTLAATGIAIWQAAVAQAAARAARNASVEANRIQEAMLALQESDAAERAVQGQQTKWDIVVEETRNRYRLIITSAGPAPARDVSVLVDGGPADAWGTVREPSTVPDVVGAGHPIRVGYMRMDGMTPPAEVTVSWSDPAGARRRTSRAPRVVRSQ